jgi:hypothetical protein
MKQKSMSELFPGRKEMVAMFRKKLGYSRKRAVESADRWVRSTKETDSAG